MELSLLDTRLGSEGSAAPSASILVVSVFLTGAKIKYLNI